MSELVLNGRTLPSVLLHQVVLLTSIEDPVAQALADKLAKRTGCKVLQVGMEPMDALNPMVEQRKLNWKDVAYMGKAAIPFKVVRCCVPQKSPYKIQHSTGTPGFMRTLCSPHTIIYN